MKVFATIMKIVAALAAIAGAAYVIAKYGDKIVAWVRDLLGVECYCEDCDGECCCGGECEECETCEERCCEQIEEADEADFEAE